MIDIQQYRTRIGCFHPNRHSKSNLNSNGKCTHQFATIIVCIYYTLFYNTHFTITMYMLSCVYYLLFIYSC